MLASILLKLTVISAFILSVGLILLSTKSPVKTMISGFNSLTLLTIF